MREESAQARALAHWYDSHPSVLRLWATQPARTGAALRVILLLQPSPDGDETSPAWMANGGSWAQQLQGRLCCPVQLECIEGSFANEPDTVDGLVAVLAWRDATVAAA